ncbi:MAG: type II toxin-antitoxin system VapC family toxin [Planctomycetota bacterium]
MIVVDASAVIELLMCSELGGRLETRLFGGDELLNAPHLLDVEVLQVVRSLVAARELSVDAARDKLERLQQMDMVRHPHTELVPRMFELRHNLTAYDAACLALAEHLGEATLVTCDRAFEKVPGRRARIEVWS